MGWRISPWYSLSPLAESSWISVPLMSVRAMNTFVPSSTGLPNTGAGRLCCHTDSPVRVRRAVMVATPSSTVGTSSQSLAVSPKVTRKGSGACLALGSVAIRSVQSRSPLAASSTYSTPRATAITTSPVPVSLEGKRGVPRIGGAMARTVPLSLVATCAADTSTMNFTSARSLALAFAAISRASLSACRLACLSTFS